MTNRQNKGRWGERLAALSLWCKGYRILARGYHGPRRSGIGEVDIIARRGSVLAFIEVKSRPSLDSGQYAIRPNQQWRIARAAQAYISHTPSCAHLSIRFDAIIVTPRRWPVHITDAWQMNA